MPTSVAIAAKSKPAYTTAELDIRYTLCFQYLINKKTPKFQAFLPLSPPSFIRLILIIIILDNFSNFFIAK